MNTQMSLREPPPEVHGTGKENQIYRRRFTEDEFRTRDLTWKVLCRDFLPQFISSADVVVDLGAGDGAFISNISAARRIAVDLSEHVTDLRDKGIETIVARADQFSSLLPCKADVILMSNFLEHLPSKTAVIQVLEECRRALKPSGRVLVLQPNIRYVGPAYWDYVDHQIALTENSLVEALEVSGYRVEKVINRFLPYTAKSRLGRLIGGNRDWPIRLYLRLPFLWKLFGQQTFVVARAAALGKSGR